MSCFLQFYRLLRGVVERSNKPNHRNVNGWEFPSFIKIKILSLPMETTGVIYSSNRLKGIALSQMLSILLKIVILSSLKCSSLSKSMNLAFTWSRSFKKMFGNMLSLMTICLSPKTLKVFCSRILPIAKRLMRMEACRFGHFYLKRPMLITTQTMSLFISERHSTSLNKSWVFQERSFNSIQTKRSKLKGVRDFRI